MTAQPAYPTTENPEIAPIGCCDARVACCGESEAADECCGREATAGGRCGCQ